MSHAASPISSAAEREVSPVNLEHLLSTVPSPTVDSPVTVAVQPVLQ